MSLRQTESHNPFLALVPSRVLLKGQRLNPRTLGATCVGGECPECEPRCAGPVPIQRLLVPLLGSNQGNDFGETWLNAACCHSGEFEDIHYRADKDILFGVIEVDDATLPESDSSSLQRVTENAYRRIFNLLDAKDYPHLWRVWNYIVDINVEDAAAGGLERYRQFNAGRQDAFIACNRLTQGQVPAACALGVRSHRSTSNVIKTSNDCESRNSPLSIAFMAGRVPIHALENARQISAWDYPDEYGPRAPTFSRAALVKLPHQTLFFISGTASIVGHRTLHLGDAAAQTRETVTNISAIIAEANTAHGCSSFSLSALDYRVYIRHATDYVAVHDVLQTLIGTARVVYVQADICRADLLVEIEASASIPQHG